MPIDVRIHGEQGPEVVVLHGGPGAPGSAQDLARALADEFRVLEPLQRLSGDRPLTVRRHVEDLAEVAPPRAAVVGASWGAMLGLSYAAAFPERVSGLVLVGCGTYDVESRALYEERMRDRLGPEGIAEAQSTRRALEEARTTEEQNRLFDSLGALAGRAQAYDPLESEGDGIVPDRRGYEETWADVLRLQETGQEPIAFAAIQAPVLMLHGADDPHPGRQIRRHLRTFVPQLELVLLHKCGHEPWRERRARERFLRLLRKRLRRHAADAGPAPSTP